MNDSTNFTHYLQLLEKIDVKFKQIVRKYPRSFSCASGCFGCCKSNLSVTHVEAELIREWLASHPEVKDRILGAGEKRIHGEEYCRYLDKAGNCEIYPVRPVICRSHGAPTLIPASADQPDSLTADICPLNFQEVSLDSLESSDWIRLDTLNLILTAINNQFDQTNSGKRTKLEDVVD